MTGNLFPSANIKRATLSACGAYRYRLTRYWGPGPLLPFVMLNPSTADHEVDDPTIRRCMGFANREGLGGIVVANLYAFRATRPEALKQANDPVGPGNRDALAAIAAEATANDLPIVCAWGATGSLFGTDRAAVEQFWRSGVRLACFGVTAHGAPRHPLYVASAEPLVPFPVR